ncbi:glycosyltransferase [Bifidobacterium dentium]|uniref:glycosyltransferase n=1 Tax=Bifidobacterium dentium TaxID=1689 RepID=UPI0018B02F1D|nr:glycosyltransferase [Bifidobacterium dentium]MBF9670163.1 glycosyltransferase [Bifidobacterium dentium]
MMTDKTCIVIVTYKRQTFLERLLESIGRLERVPWGIVIVDNESSNETSEIVRSKTASLENAGCEIWYEPQAKNLGGSGGFRYGIQSAVDHGAEWLWIMDDDVEVVPDALTILDQYSSKADAIVGNRIGFNGTIVKAPYWINSFLGIANPFNRNPFHNGNPDTAMTNILCFEGSFVSAKLVERIGPPDSSFFIYWDDVTYGYVASHFFKLLRVNKAVVRRTRDTDAKQIHDFSIDNINDKKRYYMIRNRGLMGCYFRLVGDYNPLGFRLGSYYVLIRELLRLLLAKQISIKSLRSLTTGWRDMKVSLKDISWKPQMGTGVSRE